MPRKNVRLLAGRPLIVHVLQTLAQVAPKDHVIVSTDDAEIGHLAAPFATLHPRQGLLAGDRATLDEVAVAVCEWLVGRGASKDDFLVTIQPTSPFLTRATIDLAVERLLAGADSVLTVRDDRHLRWSKDAEGHAKPLFEKRVNRQWLEPTVSETGGIIAAQIGGILADRTRIRGRTELVEVRFPEALDIDDHADWATAEYYAQRLGVVVVTDATPQMGMGHVYRGLALAHALAGHEIRFVVPDRQSLAGNFLRGTPYSVTEARTTEELVAVVKDADADIVIVDRLDTPLELVETLKKTGAPVVTFEDHGPGSRLADVVVNDIYLDPTQDDARQLSGLSNAILAPWFETVTPRAEASPTVKTVMVTFGGTDPSNLTNLTLEALSRMESKPHVEVVLGPGYAGPPPDLAAAGLSGTVHRAVPNMALLMREADLAITSGGRTVAEFLSLGVPTVVLCQNAKELTHTHAHAANGAINLGLGRYIPAAALAEYISMLMTDTRMRVALRTRALAATANRSNRAIVHRILARALPERVSP